MSARTATPTRRTVRVPFRKTSPTGHPTPERLELSLRTGNEERRVRWVGGRLRFDCIRPSGSESAAFRPTEREWERFWQTIARLGVWQWADGFERGSRGGEPTWALDIGQAGRRLRTSGFDAYPPLAEGPEPTPVFAGFCAAVSRLVDGGFTGGS